MAVSDAGVARVGISHGSSGDPRYPSPRRLRRGIGFVVDLALHLGVGEAVILLSEHVQHLSRLAGVWGLLAWILASFVHRVLIQSVWGTTLGKALFGLRLVRWDDGDKPTWGQLAKAWLLGIWTGIALIGALAGADAQGPDPEKYFLPAVRCRDIRASSSS